ncbi:MAG: hypothetical protein ABIR71_08420 [Chthoniobacterales bacterium]
MFAAEPESTPRAFSPTASSTPGLGGVPLAIGHEAKGLVLPDYSADGELQGRFEAEVAKRIDADHILFTGVKLTTYTPENTPDLAIDMPRSMLDLNTRIITSEVRTTITRADFTIEGDTLKFDTSARRGWLEGNVKMVIKNQADFLGKKDQ